MATLLRNNLNLMKNLSRWRLYLSTLSKEYNYSQVAVPNSKQNFRNGYRQFATVQAFQTNIEPALQENAEPLNSKFLSIDDSLKDLDYIVKRTGRTLKKTLEKICHLIENQGMVSQTQGLYLLRGCAFMHTEKSTQRIEFADQLWSKLQSLGCQFDVRHFNALLRVYVENKHNFSPSELLASMEKQAIEPNKMTFLYLLDKYANDGNMNGSSEVLEFMKEKGLPINEAVFNSLIKCNMRAGDVSGAKDVLEVMRSSYSPSADTYTVLACGYAEKGQIDEMNSIFREAEKDSVSLSTNHYLSVISSLPAEHSHVVDEILGQIDDIHQWKQNVLNCILDLITKDLIPTAYKLMLAIADQNDHNVTNNFLKQLVRSEKHVDIVTDYCEKIGAHKLNEFAFVNAAKAAVDFEKYDYAVKLFEKLNQRGIPVRCSFFWQVFEHNKNSEKGIWSTLKTMQELGIPPDFRTLKEFVFPSISLDNPQHVITKVQEAGLSVMAVVDPLFHYYCSAGKFKSALYLVENCPVTIYSNFEFEKFVSLYDGSHEYFDVLRYVMKTNENISERDSIEFQGRQLAFLIHNNPALFQTFIKKQQNKKDGFKFRENAIKVCYNILRQKSPDKLMHLRALERSQPQKIVHKTLEQEDKELSLLKQRGVPTEHYIVERLHQHVNERNVQRVDKLRSELDNLGVTYPPLLYAQLLSMYCDLSNLEEADKVYLALKEKYPTFDLQSNKMLLYAELLIKFSKWEEAKKVIANECKELQLFGNKDLVARSIKRLLFAVIETGNEELVKSIQESLLPHAHIFENNSYLYEPMIRVYLHRNELNNAINEFRKCVTTHDVVPCLNLLLRKCIVADDQEYIKTVITIASGLIPEHAVLYELALEFTETGRSVQAVKVIQNIKDKKNPYYVEDICFRLYNQKRVAELEKLLPLVQDVENLGKEKIFYNLFKLYDERNDYKKSLELLQLIEENKLFDPSDRIKNIVSNLSAKSNRSVSSPSKDELTQLNSENIKIITSFLDSVNNKNVSQALEKLENMKKGIIHSLPADEMCKFVDLLVQKQHTSDLVNNAQAMSYIIENTPTIIRPLLEKYATNGEVESLKTIASFIPDFALKKVFFNTYYARSHFVSGKSEDLLVELESNMTKDSSKIFCIAALQGLLKNSEFEERVINLAKGHLERNFDLPIGIIWAHYIVQRDFEKANALYKVHTIPVEKVDSTILKLVRQDNDSDLGRLYLDLIKHQNTKGRVKERAYSTMLDVLVSKKQYEDATALLSEAKQVDVDLEKYCPSTVASIKAALEEKTSM